MNQARFRRLSEVSVVDFANFAAYRAMKSWRQTPLLVGLNFRSRLPLNRVLVPGTLDFMNSSSKLQRRFACYLIITAVIASPLLGFSQTPGMKHRQDRRDDRTDRVQKRDDKMVERRDDPIGVRGPQRRKDHRDLRTDRKSDRRERLY